MSYKRNVILSVLLIVFILASTIVGFGFVAKRTTVECLRNLDNASTIADAKFMFLFSSHIGALTNIGELFVTEASFHDPEIAQYIRGVRTGPLKVPVRVYLPDGFIISDKGASVYPKFASQYRSIVSPRPYLSSVHEDFINSGEKVMELFLPIRLKGQIACMMSVVIDVRLLPKFISSNAYGGRATLWMMDRRDSVVILNSETNKIQKVRDLFSDRLIDSKFTLDEWISSVFSGEKAYIAYTTKKNGEKKYISAKPSLVNDFMVMSEVKEEIAFEKYFLFRKIFILLSLIQFLAFIAYLIWMIRDIRKRVEAENREYTEIASALSESFDSIYYVNTTDDSYLEFNSHGKYKNLSIKTTGQKFFQETAENIKLVVYKEDIPEFSKALQRENFISQLETEKFVSLEYRLIVNGFPEYYRLKALKSPKNESHIIIAVENVNEEVRKAIVQRRKIERSNSMIESLALDFDCVNYVELASDGDSDVLDQFRVSLLFSQVIPGWSTELLLKNRMELLLNNVVHEDDRENFYAKTQRNVIIDALENQPVYSVNFRAVIDNEEHFYQIKFIADKSSTDRLKGFVVGIHCIDEEVKQQMEIQKRLERNLEIIDILSEEYTGLYFLNLNERFGNALAVNDLRMMENVGLDSDRLDLRDAFSKFVENYVHPEDKKYLEALMDYDEIRQRLMYQKRLNVVFRRSYDGVYKFSRMTIAKAEKVNEPPSFVAIGFTEIDRQHRAEAERQENIDRIMSLSDEFEAIFDVNIDTGMFTVSSKSGQITDDLLGNLMGESDFFINNNSCILPSVYLEDQDMMITSLSRAYMLDRLGKETSYTIDYRIVRGENVLWYRMKVARIGSWAKEHRMLVGIFNNDARYRREKAQQEALEQALMMAKSASRAKTTFLNNMSHDIRTPMNAIIGYTGLASTHIDNKDQVKDYLGKITQSSNHLLSLINDVLDMSRIESGKMNLNEMPENIPDIVHSLKDIVQADVRSKQLNFFVDTVDINDEDVLCDKLRLNQVLLNVLSNAIKYTPAGGTVSMRIIQTTATQMGSASYEFRIKDNGIGMSKEFLKTIYDPFTRVNSSTVSGIQGTGLGMAITKNIVKMMGGTIDIKSEENIGSEIILNFEFRLAHAHKEFEEIPELNGVRSIVVDDDTNTCRSISKMLKEMGMRSEWCVSGKETLIRVEEAKVDEDEHKLFIIDWMMPDMNGIETARQIRRIIGDEAVILILTAYDWSDIEHEAREAGVTNFVSKPLFPSDLRLVLKHYFTHEVEKEASAPETYNFSGKKILLVEDNEINREIAKELLEDIGFNVRAVTDGSLAVETMQKARPGDFDVILMDVQMPIMDGYEATRRIRAFDNKDIANIPIIAMTANAFAEDREAAIAAGMNDHVPKPVDMNKLKESLSKVL